MKLISLNIEGTKHYETVLPFLQQENADVVCLQEVSKEDLPLILENVPYENVFYTPQCIKHIDGTWTFGHVILTNHPARQLSQDYYYSHKEDPYDLPTFSYENISETVNRVVTVVEVTIGEESFVIGNTHFTWTPDGQVDDWQRRDMPKLLEFVSKHSELILCGDFNAPRGRGSWAALCERFTDNIPPEVENTLDPERHRVPTLRYVVDGMFTTDHYRAENVRVHCGVSDHCAIVGEISTTNS